jgi:hypothetical protein
LFVVVDTTGVDVVIVVVIDHSLFRLLLGLFLPDDQVTLSFQMVDLCIRMNDLHCLRPPSHHSSSSLLHSSITTTASSSFFFPSS